MTDLQKTLSAEIAFGCVEDIKRSIGAVSKLSLSVYNEGDWARLSMCPADISSNLRSIAETARECDERIDDFLRAGPYRDQSLDCLPLEGMARKVRA